jgi:hypothetical protein
MKELIRWLKRSLSHLWKGLLENLGTAIGVFIVSGGYLFAINKLHEFQRAIRRIPTDYVLTPLVLVVVVAGALWNINRQQRKQLSQIQQQPQTNNQSSRFVTHYGVWWRIYSESEYIEDFPYCPCCESRKKLVQTEWHPDEVFKCPATGTEVKLYDGVPRNRSDLLRRLRDAYFGGARFEDELSREFQRLKELNPAANDLELLRRVFTFEPFNRIPREEVDAIFDRFQNAQEVLFFIRRNHRAYRRFLRRIAGE